MLLVAIDMLAARSTPLDDSFFISLNCSDEKQDFSLTTSALL
jgi:hypothetical protein